MKKVILLLALGLAACGGALKYEVPATSKAPGADAKIVANVLKDQNQTSLDVEVSNLPPPARVSEGATSYIAWQRRDSNAQWSRVGSVKYDEGSRKAKLLGTAPETNFDFSVTAEKDAAPAAPSAEVVFSQHIGK